MKLNYNGNAGKNGVVNNGSDLQESQGERLLFLADFQRAVNLCELLYVFRYSLTIK